MKVHWSSSFHFSPTQFHHFALNRLLRCKFFQKKVSVPFGQFIPNAKLDLQSAINNEKQNYKTRQDWEATVSQCSAKRIFMSETFPKFCMQNRACREILLFHYVLTWTDDWRPDAQNMMWLSHWVGLYFVFEGKAPATMGIQPFHKKKETQCRHNVPDAWGVPASGDLDMRTVSIRT